MWYGDFVTWYRTKQSSRVGLKDGMAECGQMLPYHVHGCGVGSGTSMSLPIVDVF